VAPPIPDEKYLFSKNYLPVTPKLKRNNDDTRQRPVLPNDKSPKRLRRMTSGKHIYVDELNEALLKDKGS